jgi:hypothetical protein
MPVDCGVDGEPSAAMRMVDSGADVALMGMVDARIVPNPEAGEDTGVVNPDDAEVEYAPDAVEHFFELKAAQNETADDDAAIAAAVARFPPVPGEVEDYEDQPEGKGKPGGGKDEHPL